VYGCESDGEEDLETTRKAELPQPTAAFANLAFLSELTHHQHSSSNFNQQKEREILNKMDY